MKAKFGNGVVPVWTQDKKEYQESRAILRFLGAQHGYYPKNDLHAWKADAIVDYISEWLPKINKPLVEGDLGHETQKFYCKSLETIVLKLTEDLKESPSDWMCGN